MKKLILTLAAIAAVTFSSSAQITLSDAYSSLAELPGMSIKATNSVQIDGITTIDDARVSTVKTSNAGAMRNEFFYMIESLPLRSQVIGANNQHEIASIFAEPAANGKYNVLIMKGDASTGEFSAVYGQTDRQGVEAINSCELTMDAKELTMTPADKVPVDNHYMSMTE